MLDLDIFWRGDIFHSNIGGGKLPFFKVTGTILPPLPVLNSHSLRLHFRLTTEGQMHSFCRQKPRHVWRLTIF